jgi:hypothetical protein
MTAVSGRPCLSQRASTAARGPSQHIPIKRNPQTIIPFEEIERFKAEYVSLFLLARGCGKHMPVLLRELQAQGVQPAPELDGVGATFFKRSEVPS